MTRAATLPLSFAAHGAALAAVVVLAVGPAELPAARAASPLPVDVAVFRTPPVPVASDPRPAATPRTRPLPTPATHGNGPVATVVPTANPIEGPVIDAPLSDTPSTDAPGLPCVGCTIGSPVQPSGGTETGGETRQGDPLRIGGHIREPHKLRHVAPAYPDIARAARVQGRVTVECTLTPEGHVADARIVSGHPLLNPAALAAVQQWLFTPTLLNGVPVPVILTVTVKFELR